MPKRVIQYNLLISCPSDVEEELEVINKVVEDFNIRYEDTLGIRVSAKHWSKHSYAQSGGKPQELLNEQFVYDCDAAVAIFWTKFGTPTDKYGSGTEEEIEYMLEKKRQVFMYFSSKPIKPDKVDDEQYRKIKEFKNKYKDKGIYCEYDDNEDFEKKFSAHLAKYFLTLDSMKQIKEENHSVLKIQCINNDKIIDAYKCVDFVIDPAYNTKNRIEEIKNLISDINHIKLSSSYNNAFISLPNKTRVVISEDKREMIKEIAKDLGCIIEKDFFELGDLCKDSLSFVFSGSDSLDGTEVEKQKYFTIIELADSIHDLMAWMPYEQMFDGLKCIKLVITNAGTAVDEDIDITINMPKGMLIYHQSLPIQEKDTLHTMNEQVDLDDIFGIKKSVNYYDYASSKMKSGLRFSGGANTYPMLSRDYEEEYLEDLDKIFLYEIYEDDDFDKLKLHVDYIKHNNSVAFPTVIFVSEDFEKDISYEITSKNSIEVIKGKLCKG